MGLDRGSGYRSCEKDREFRRIMVPLRLKAGDCAGDGVQCLIEMLAQTGNVGQSHEQVTALMNGVVRERLINKGEHFSERDVVALRRELEKFKYFFTRLDCDDLGLELQILHVREGGPSPMEVSPLVNLLVEKLGSKRVRIKRIPYSGNGIVDNIIEGSKGDVMAFVEKAS